MDKLISILLGLFLAAMTALAVVFAVETFAVSTFSPKQMPHVYQWALIVGSLMGALFGTLTAFITYKTHRS